MFIVFMLSRLRKVFPALAVVFGSLLPAAGCQRVPLLAPTGSTITLIAAATALPINGSTDIIAQLIEAAGTPPHTGTHISFTTTLGSIQPSEAETDISGRVVVKFLAGAGSGTATIAALSGGASASGTNAIKIAIGSAAVGGVSVTASPTSLSASGGSSTITAAVTDLSGNVLPNVPVTFTTDTGSLSASVANTGASGTAQTVLTTSKTAKVTATAGVTTTSGTTTTAAPKSDVTVTVNAAATVVFGSFSPAVPVAGQPVSFTLTITPAATGAAIRQVVVNFGDGRSQTLGAVSGATSLSHTYDSAGTFTLSATVTDSNGDPFVGVANITVGGRLLPVVSISVAGTTQPTTGSITVFNITANAATNSTATIRSVTVDFGDGSSVDLGGQSGTSIPAQHIYQSAGTYRVTVVAQDSNGSSNSAATLVVVQARQPLGVSITSTQSASAGTTVVTFTASVTPATGGPTIGRYDWTFGDGASQTTTGNVVTHSYTTGTGPRTVAVTVTATDGQTATNSTVVVP